MGADVVVEEEDLLRVDVVAQTVGLKQERLGKSVRPVRGTRPEARGDARSRG